MRLLRDPRCWLALLMIAGVLVYARGVAGDFFLFDDFQNIVLSPPMQMLGKEPPDWIGVMFLNATGPTRRPLSMLSFALNILAFGMSPPAFKVVNLLLHLANGALLYALLRRIASRLLPAGGDALARRVALFAAAAWLLHPLNLSSVAYVVQRMTELSALFTLAGLLCYAESRSRMLDGEPALPTALAGLLAFGLLAVASKENGALVILYALVVEASCFRFAAPGAGGRRSLRAFFALAIGLPAIAIAAYLVTHPGWLVHSYSIRDFTLAERVLTEFRVLCHYLAWIVVPNPAWMGLYHDDIAVSTSLVSPPTTLAAVAFLAGLVAAAWRLRRRAPAFAFGIAWFLVGHSIESTVLPLELVFEHRNYLPMAGLLLGAACTVAGFASADARRLRMATFVGVLFVVVCAVATASRAGTWSSPLRMATADVRHHPDSARSQFEAGRAIVIDGAARGQRDAADLEALPYFERAARLDRNDTHGLIEATMIRARRGEDVGTAVAEIRTRLAQARTYTRANPFLDMLVTASLQKTSLAPADVAGLVEAALSNRRFPPTVRAMIMNNFGAYRFNIARDAQGAVSLTLAAAAEEPTNPYFELNLAKLALAMRDLGKARHHLDRAQRLDVARVQAAGIAALARDIAAAAANAQPAPDATP